MKTDPNKKKKKPVSSSGSGAHLSRDNKGNIVARKDKNYYGGPGNGRTPGTGDMTFGGAPAPRVGGNYVGGAKSLTGTAKKSTIKKAIRSVKKSAASPQAKRAARKSFKY